VFVVFDRRHGQTFGGFVLLVRVRNQALRARSRAFNYGAMRRCHGPADIRSDPSVEDNVVQRTRKLPPPEDVVAAIVELADDGFCRRGELLRRFPRLGERDLRRAVRRAASQGLVLERRGPEGAWHVAVSSEGWNLLRSG
jgi:hypothetical protein